MKIIKLIAINLLFISTPLLGGFSPEEILLGEIRTQYGETDENKDVIMTLDRELPEALLQIEKPEDIEVEEFSLNGEKFLAKIRKDDATYDIKGKFEDVLLLPVANRLIQPGEIISEDDLDTKEISESKLKNYMITDANEIIGLTPKRLIAPNQFIKTSQLQKKKDVEKGQTIQVHYKSGNLNITSPGKSLDHGTLGDMVRVMNPQSKKIIEGFVTGTGEVSLGG